MVYSFFDPKFLKRSLGHFMILDHISNAKAAHYAYLYLGYFVRSSQKMSYKARYKPYELLIDSQWTLHN
jgi:arginine-tRNA-protein transferase